jgi:hypothetical protein
MSDGRKIGTYFKAIVGFVAPGVVAIGSALTVNSDGGGNITQYEWVSALIACLVTGGFVYAIPNQPYVKREQDPAMEDPAPDPQPGLGHPENLQPPPATRGTERWSDEDIRPH